ncbi:hypothetical protein KY285_016331 [Solanum tuberosum]|nr:hypothetical protein KY284_016327 [Solanum tuberosum]KAH0702053.1 hypothetical protein KY285_016331 [Solanum tuberosum]
MAKRHTIETVYRSFRDIMDKDAPFGGKIMVFGGDFRQVLPVVPKSTRAETVDASLVRSYLWPLMDKIQLSTNMRATKDTTFNELLLRIGNGEEITIKNLIALPQQMIVQQSRDDNLNELMNGKFRGETKIYISFDAAEDDTNNYYQEEYLNTLTPNGLPPHRYIIKYIKTYT